jgi:nicotinamidase-related amidase
LTVSNRFAFVVLDMLVDFFERQPALVEQRARLVSAINDLTAALRRTGNPIIWVRQEFQPDLSDAFLDMRRRNIHITVAGTPGCQLLPELERSSADLEVIKKRYSAFFETSLDSLLRQLQPKTLIVGGINTHACVRTTAIDAFQRDYDVVVATDCTGSYDSGHHHVTLQYFDGKIARLLGNAAIKEMLLDTPM